METVGPYRLDALVGRGTTGSVWRATRIGVLAHVVAVKRARTATGDEGTDRLRREAEILAELDHPHIVRVIDVLDDDDAVAIVMSFARGGSLHDLLAERGRLTPGQTVAVLSRIADALGSAHRRGVFHGDVKPANILFTTDGEPLLGDFGVAQHLLPGLAGLDGVGGLPTVEGTAGYVDPALVESGRPEPRNDVYGLAVVAYLCLTGRLPHAGTTSREILAAAEVGDHPTLLDDEAVPPRLAELVEAALAREPSRRPASAEAMAVSLRATVSPSQVALPGVALAVVAPPDDDRPPADDPDDVDGEAGVGAGAGRRAVGAATPDGATPPPRGTRAFGPRPPEPDAEPEAGRPLVTGLVVVVLLAGAIGGGLWARARLAAEQAPGRVAVEAGGTPRGIECPTVPAIEVPNGAEELMADFEGDGCPVQVVWDGRVMRFRLEATDAEPRTFQFEPEAGGRGQLVVGDWDCDGADTPAFYQPGTGRVAYFSDVPERVQGEVDAQFVDTGVIDGRAEVAADDDGCDTVEVSAQA